MLRDGGPPYEVGDPPHKASMRFNNNNINIYLLQLGCYPVAVVILHVYKMVTTEFKSGGLHEKHVVATWNLGNHLSICL